MNLKNFLWFTGIWTYPPLAALFYFIIQSLAEDFHISPIAGLLIAFVIPLLFPAIITWTNIERKQRGQTDFSFAATYGLATKDERHSKAYLDAAYPDIPAQYASKIPKDVVLGKHKGKYVYCPLIKGSLPNGIILGTPGSGKSVMLLGWLYSLLFRNEIAKKSHGEPGSFYNFFIVDIKGELYEKLLGIRAEDYKATEHPDFHVIAPSVKDSFGYDVFYKLRGENVSETEIIKAVTDIADALVVATGDNPYFSDNAKKILEGVTLWGYYQGYDFLPIIQTLMSTNLDELLTAIVADAEQQNMGIVLQKLKNFVGKSENESVADIETTLKTYLEVFSYPELQWVLHDNPNKTSPRVLNDGKTSLDLAIHESMLVPYMGFFRLVSLQILRHCESELKEGQDRKTLLLWDEFPRCGEIPHIENSLATLRSKNCGIMMFGQSVSQLKMVYPREKAQTLLNLCELKIFLSGSGDKDTTDYVSGMVGDYTTDRMSYKRKGVFGGKSDGNYSPERRPIVEARDMMELRERAEMLAFVYGHYIRCKKLRYFEDPYIAPILKRRQQELAALHEAQAQAEPTKKDTTT